MFRTIADFQDALREESSATRKVFGVLTEASLSQAVKPGGRTLGRLAWHITQTLSEMPGEAKLVVEGPKMDDPLPSLAEIIRQYEAVSKRLAAAVSSQWTDAMLAERVPMYGEEWARGRVLAALIAHEVHHRAQMTVLMRQAGLIVPGVYGPAHEEWGAMNMPPQP